MLQSNSHATEALQRNGMLEPTILYSLGHYPFRNEIGTSQPGGTNNPNSVKGQSEKRN